MAIATETITGGGLAHYTEDLDRMLRAYAGPGQIVEGVPYVSPLHRAQSLGRLLLARWPFMRQWLKRVRKSRASDPWKQAPEWAAIWRNRPQQTIAVVPHVVIHDGGHLDDYYAALAEHPFVLVIHDLHALHFPEEWKPADLAALKARFGLLCRSALRIIVHNEFTAGDVSDKLGIERERISVVLLPAFFKEAAHQASTSTDRARLGRLGIIQPYALWASSSTYAHKNHKRLIEAWRILADRGHALQLVCTGSREPHWNEIHQLLEENNLQASVRFTGIVDDKDLAAVMRNANLAVCPTLFEGGGPGPAAEAAIAGIPLTLSSIPQCHQLFNHRTDLCTFFDPYSPAAIADAVQEILLDYPGALSRAQRAKVEYPKLRTERMAAEQYWQAVLAAREQRLPSTPHGE